VTALLTLADGATEVSIALLGGEMYSLRRLWRAERRELIHRAEGPGWRGGAPWLFPAVGRNFVEGRAAWRFAGAEHPMPIHGFAMAAAWKGEVRPASIACRTASDAATRRFFPFDYELQAEYFLSPAGVRAEATVTAGAGNRGDMPFSLGSHLTLALPLGPGGDAGAHVVRSPARVEEPLDERGLLSGASARHSAKDAPPAGGPRRDDHEPARLAAQRVLP